MNACIDPFPHYESLKSLSADFSEVLKAIKPLIYDDSRASDDCDEPSVCVTFGVSWDQERGFRWSYQTGDNSYFGGAYSHPEWCVVYLFRDSDCEELGVDAVAQLPF